MTADRSTPVPANIRHDLNLLTDSREAEFYRAPTPREMEARQAHLWRSIHAERTDPPVPFTIAERIPPYRLLFDFSMFDVSDKAIIRIEVEIFGPNPEQRRWQLSEEHVIGIYGHEGIAHLEINEQPVSRGRLLEISPMDGPWVARVTYAQTLGFSKTVRVALLPSQ